MLSKKLLQTKCLVALYCPPPTYPVHPVLLPKQAMAGLTDGQPDALGWRHDLIAAVQQLVKRPDLERAGYHLILGDGQYQPPRSSISI